MEMLATLILIIFGLLGFVAIFFTTFGTLIILLGTVIYALLTNFSILNIQDTLLILLLYFIGEVSEYLFIIVGAKKFGASTQAILGALVGGVVGALVGILVFGGGLFLSTLLGIFAGAFLVEFIIHKDIVRSAKAAMGGVLGRVLSIGVKVLIAFLMFGIIVYNLTCNFNKV